VGCLSMGNSDRAGALRGAETHFDDGHFKDTLSRRVAIPTTSAEKSSAPAMQRYMDDEIGPALKAMGYEVEAYENPDPSGWPILLGTRIEDTARPTLLTYGHGDVVVGLDDQWTDGLSPWTLAKDGERWYGRGTADNKGQHSIVMAGLEQVLEARGQHGFNSKILIDMGEEIGSPGLDIFVRDNPELLAADVLVGSDGPRMVVERPDVKLGNRGALSFDLRVDLREGSRHSGHWGGVLTDPGIVLGHALASICDRKGRILVPGWTPQEIPANVKSLLAECRVSPGNDFPEIDPGWGEPGLSREEKMFGWTSFIVLAFETGEPANPVNGVAPNAWARCQLRFTMDVDPNDFLPQLRQHLDAEGFPEVEVVALEDDCFFPAHRTDPDHPAVDWARRSIAETMGEAPLIVPNSAGGLPSRTFADGLGNLPILWIPHSYTGCKQHGPNEHVLEPLMRDGLRIMTGLFWDLGELDGGFDGRAVSG